MNKIEKMVKEMCPNGVEYKTIGDIATDIYRGAGITRNQVTHEGVPCVRYGEIYTTYGIYFSNCISHTNENVIVNKKYFEHGDILFAITGESVEEIAKSTAYVGNEKCLAGGDIVVLKHNQNPKYLSYVLSTTIAQMQKGKGKVKSKVVHSSVPAIKEIVISVPPIEIQHEIVRILDNFTSLTAELTAELTARNKQYEYYRDKLLNDPVGAVNAVGVNDETGRGEALRARRIMKLGDIGKVSMCKRIMKSETTSSGEVPFYKIGTFGGKADAYITKDLYERYKREYSFSKKGDVLISASGTIGRTIIYDGEPAYFQDSNIVWIDNDETKVLNKYLFYFYQTNPWKISTGGTIARLYNDNLASIQIAFPPINIQTKIVHVLDHFESICKDLNIGLPAEIEARKKQYEYYRDALLNFAETGNVDFVERERESSSL